MKPILTTERLLLRQFTTADYQRIYEINSDPAVMHFIFNGATHSREEATAYLDKIVANYPKTPNLGSWAIEMKDTGDFVGLACLRQFEQPEKRELGYRLRKAYWGKGIATEISNGLVAYGFQTLNLPQIMAVVVKENKASRGVLEKAGLKHTGSGIYYGSELEYYEMDNPNLKTNTYENNQSKFH